MHCNRRGHALRESTVMHIHASAQGDRMGNHRVDGSTPHAEPPPPRAAPALTRRRCCCEPHADGQASTRRSDRHHAAFASNDRQLAAMEMDSVPNSSATGIASLEHRVNERVHSGLATEVE